ncbi:hypothetical protein [Enterobacter hormaechei]|uniref:hypothetical protein n=1 Tax=Enterobacter hormaechei TaxID=158836 RepID=UPI001FEC8CF4|nr:hypothetical protein [Enterobacter hormaechei]
MSTITKEFTKEQLQQIEAAAKEVMWPVVWSEKKAREHFSEKITPKVVLKLARIALASLEAEAVCVIDQSNLDYLKSGSDADVWPASRTEMGDVLLYRSATPAPVSVPDAIHSQGEKSASDDYYALGWNACRAAMLKHSEPFIVTSDHRMMEMPQVEAINAVTAILQGADGTLTNEGTIPVTQFKPVADLYGLTSPTGGETSFTFDAVEARDFIDGGWSCQEYVELERFQEAITNHTEDKLAMVDHSGDSNNMVEPVTTACKLRDAVDTIRNSGIAIDGEKIFAERDALNAPDYWCRTCRPITLTDMRFVVCPECGNKRCPHANDHRNACTGSNEPGQEGSAYPAAPQQEDRIQCCRTHPQTALQVHPFEMLMSLPPKQKMYCPECEPGVAERIDMMKNISSPKVGE